jgi:rhamnosyl/mannosyltransferase
MRVLMISKDAILGGMSRHCVELANALAPLGVDVLLLSPRAVGRRRADELALDSLRTIRPASLGRLFSTELSPGLALRTFFESADVVHVHLPCPVALPALLVRRRNPLIATYHCDLDRRFGLLGAAHEWATRRLLRHADAIVATTDDLAKSPVLRESRSRVWTVPYGVAAERCSPSSETETIARSLTDELGDRVVLFVGRLVYYKGVDVLLHAMRGVSGTLVIVGDGPERGRLEALAERLGLGRSVRFVGTVSRDAELGAYYSLAKVFVLPSVSHGEAFGIVQVEAALFSLPLVSTSLPGVSWVNTDGETGIVVPPRDPRALARAINTLLDDHALATKLGESARARATTTFLSGALAARMLAIYREALGRARGRSS